MKEKDIVIYVDNAINKVGMIERVYRFRKRDRVYNIRTEYGSLLTYIPVDSFGSQIYISSELTAKVAPKVKTNLNLITNANIR